MVVPLTSEAIQIYYQSYKMKERLAYSPKEGKQQDKYEINFKKSPQKYVLYDSPHYPQDHSNNTNPFAQPPQPFQNIKKVNEESAALRQTMNTRFFNRMQKNHVLDFEQQKPNKLNDFLRQTMSFKSTKALSETLIPDYAYSGDFYEQQANNKQYETYKGQKRGMQLIDESKSLKDYERLNDKINRNKQLIQQLRKTTNKAPKQKDLLKNVNHYRSPTYIAVDNMKQKEDVGFKKGRKQQEHNYFLTPKVDKGNYQSRFNSSPLIQQSRSHEKTRQQPTTISSLTSISSIKKKSSSISKIGGLIDEFSVDKKLGQGKFGAVYLAKHKKTNSLFALKKIPKALIKSNLMVDQLALQIRIQSCLKNTNILQIYGCFDDKTHLYIVLQYMDGGTLYQKMKKQKMHQRQAASIIRQITTAIDYLHDIGIAHRDLKPQNIVISNDVYKLCDFGWAAICNERRKTYCGTFDYVAPEILQGVQYDMTVDLWCLGVLTYELLTGKAPFYHISRKQTVKKILNVENGPLVFPESLSEQAKDFIEKLIKKNPEQRIRTPEALSHPFLVVRQDQN